MQKKKNMFHLKLNSQVYMQNRVGTSACVNVGGDLCRLIVNALVAFIVN